MTHRTAILIRLGIVCGIIVACAVVDFIWIMPQIQVTRTAIDNDRTSTTVITQQQSNLQKLTQDVGTITTKQAELAPYVWLFAKENDFFAFLSAQAKTHQLTMADPAIVDATPTGALITRPVTLTLHGSLANILAAVNDLQSHTPLIAIQNIDFGPGVKTNDVTATIVASTQWQ